MLMAGSQTESGSTSKHLYSTHSQALVQIFSLAFIAYISFEIQLVNYSIPADKANCIEREALRNAEPMPLPRQN